MNKIYRLILALGTAALAFTGPKSQAQEFGQGSSSGLFPAAGSQYDMSGFPGGGGGGGGGGNAVYVNGRDIFASGGTGDQGIEHNNLPTGEGVNAFGPNAAGSGRTIYGRQQQQYSPGSSDGHSGTQQMVDNPWAQPQSNGNQILRPGAYSSPNAQGTLEMIPTWAPSLATAQGGYNMGAVPSGQFSFGFPSYGPSAAGAKWSQGFGGLPQTSTSSVDLNIVE